MKVKIFTNVNVRQLEKDVNEFIHDKKVVKIKMSPGPAESEAMNILVMYEE